MTDHDKPAAEVDFFEGVSGHREVLYRYCLISERVARLMECRWSADCFCRQGNSDPTDLYIYSERIILFVERAVSIQIAIVRPWYRLQSFVRRLKSAWEQAR